jgi:hypothetical protein
VLQPVDIDQSDLSERFEARGDTVRSAVILDRGRATIFAAV